MSVGGYVVIRCDPFGVRIHCGQQPVPLGDVRNTECTIMKWQPQKMIWWYWALIDAMIANPECTKKELAAQFKVSEVCIHLITTSDVFNAYLAERRAGNSKMLDEAIRLKLKQTAVKVLATIQPVFEKKKDSIPLSDLTSLADKTLERLGYGVI